MASGGKSSFPARSVLASPLFLLHVKEDCANICLCLRCRNAGFEGCSMVPSIYPLETLHNSLSLKQVDEFLNTVCESSSEAHAKTMRALSSLFDSQSQSSLYSPHNLPSPSGSETSLQPPSQPLWHGSIPSSAVSSASPSSPITESPGLTFSICR
ncbi:hypothetical protein LDENG_00075080 [Lucifuga dentata]|nr:hypothetical protein LDENG_00075080 [Lucifuga dentata]